MTAFSIIRSRSQFKDQQMSSTPTGQKIVGGTIWVFLAEALLLPTGILTAAVLTRRLGPEGYGLLTIAATLIGWIGWSITSVFTRTTIKFVSEADDWRSIGAAVLRLHLLLSVPNFQCGSCGTTQFHYFCSH
jgi:hypothetical protein